MGGGDCFSRCLRFVTDLRDQDSSKIMTVLYTTKRRLLYPLPFCKLLIYTPNPTHDDAIPTFHVTRSAKSVRFAHPAVIAVMSAK